MVQLGCIVSVGNKDGITFGDPNCELLSGKINGAVQFDGIDDYISTPFVINPAAGNFSIFAWIKGGVPGQVILSQYEKTNLLSVDPNGCLMTELKGSITGNETLVSATVITDDNWHHVGLVWDGSYRTLYVDNVIAAKDTSPQGTLPSSTNGFYIGTGKGNDSGSYFSGLIDDVRIYNTVIKP